MKTFYLHFRQYVFCFRSDGMWWRGERGVGAGYSVEYPWCRPLFSERNGYRKTVWKATWIGKYGVRLIQLEKDGAGVRKPMLRLVVGGKA